MGAAPVIPQRDYYYFFQGNYVRSITSAQALAATANSWIGVSALYYRTLGTAAGASTIEALVAATVPHHDRATNRARWCVLV